MAFGVAAPSIAEALRKNRGRIFPAGWVDLLKAFRKNDTVDLLLIAGQFWLIRDRYSRRDILEILLQIPFSFLFAAFIDFNMMFTGQLHPGSYGLSVALLLTGCVVQSIGVVLEIKPRVAMMSAEAFVKYASQRYNREFGKFKVCFDITLVTLAAVLSFLLSQRIEGIREGSLIAACITGYIVTFLNRRIITRKTLYNLLPILQKKTSRNG